MTPSRSSRNSVPASDARIDPMQPSRFEKKTNIRRAPVPALPKSNRAFMGCRRRCRPNRAELPRSRLERACELVEHGLLVGADLLAADAEHAALLVGVSDDVSHAEKELAILLGLLGVAFCSRILTASRIRSGSCSRAWSAGPSDAGSIRGAADTICSSSSLPPSRRASA